MNVWVSYTGTIRKDIEVEWPEDWPIPREGDGIDIPGLPEVTTVRHVSWYPNGDNEGNDDPYVYIVIGPRRPH